MGRPGLRRGIEPAHLRPAQNDGQTDVPEDFAGLYLMLKLVAVETFDGPGDKPGDAPVAEPIVGPERDG